MAMLCGTRETPEDPEPLDQPVPLWPAGANTYTCVEAISMLVISLVTCDAAVDRLVVVLQAHTDTGTDCLPHPLADTR
jgi:hypothetical protein